MKTIKVALVGQPNVGKSYLINSISGAQLHVGNFSGVTVDKKEVFFERGNYRIEMIDLPGIYSLAAYTPEEEVTKKYLYNEEYDVILNVIDANQLQRGLSFTYQIADMGKKIVCAFNMYDEFSAKGGEIDTDLFEKITNIKAVNTSAREKLGIEEVFNAVIETYESEVYPKIQYSDYVENAILEIKRCIKNSGFTERFTAIRLLDEDPDIYKIMHDKPFFIACTPILLKEKKILLVEEDEEDTQTLLNNERNAMAKGLVRQIAQTAQKETLTEKIDNILINPIFGLPIFLFFMWAIFQLTFTLGSIPMDYIDAGFGAFGDFMGDILPSHVISTALVDGVIPAVGAVAMFLPNILVLFFGINLLEQTGYMARAAYVMDGLLKKFGLQGRSFVPLVSGFGCTVPAYMAARTLKNPKDRIITMLILGFMSCGARLPVYTVLVGAFFASSIQGNVMFAIYIGGAIMGLIVAKILRLTLFKGESEPFAMEMPKYRFPSFKAIVLNLWIKAKMYLKKAGTFIAIAAFCIWFLSYFPQNHKELGLIDVKIETASQVEKVVLENEKNSYILENSYLADIGKTIEPIFAPLGFGWKESVAVITGLAAKEVMVSTMAVLYHTDEEDERLGDIIKENITIASAVAMILLVMIYSPCFASISTFFAEVKEWKWRIFYLIYPNVLAWIMAFIGFNLAL